MKTLKKYLLLLILFIPFYASAASSSIAVTSASTGVVGNQLTVTVTISSGQALGSWELDVSYPKDYLELSSVGNKDDCGSTTSCKGVVENSSTKSKKYTFTFKVKKSGNATVNATGTVYLYDESRTTAKGAKTISLKTQAEIEASYSANAYLKSLTVGDYTLTPVFNKETYTYDVEVENEIESVTINATKEDANANVSGTGDKELLEGPNKFEIVVTAQKGNSLTYTVNINRKELNPIKVTVNGKEMGIVRKKDLLPALEGFVESTVTYEETEIPALYNDVLDLYVIGLKDEEGNVETYTFTNSSLGTRYISVKTGEKIINLLSYEEEIYGFKVEEFTTVDSFKLKGVAISNNQCIISGRDVLTGDVNTYLYDKVTNTFIPYDTTLIKEVSERNKTFFLAVIILGVVVFLLFILLITKKGDKQPKEKKNKVNEVKEIKVEEIKEEPEEIKVTEIKEDKKASKKKAKKEKNRLKDLEEVIETPKEEVKKDEDEVDDPLNDDDDFMEFWETMEIKTQKK
jgi:hypothetical protein